MTRLDAALVARGLVRSREVAAECVRAGQVEVNGRTISKPAHRVADGDELVVRGELDRWVGRAAYKLLGAFELWPQARARAEGARCLDVGASTGGFTQVLLEHGAEHVTALDVGHGQLVASLAADPRVTDLPGTNIREVAPGDLGERFDLVVADLSFISLRLALAPIVGQLAPGGMAVLLVKPQFEVGRERLARTGVVGSVHEHRRVLDEVLTAAEETGLELLGLARSPLPGGNGNVEFLGWWRLPDGEAIVTADSPALAERRRGMIEAAARPGKE